MYVSCHRRAMMPPPHHESLLRVDVEVEEYQRRTQVPHQGNVQVRRSSHDVGHIRLELYLVADRVNDWTQQVEQCPLRCEQQELKIIVVLNRAADGGRLSGWYAHCPRWIGARHAGRVRGDGKKSL